MASVIGADYSTSPPYKSAITTTYFSLLSLSPPPTDLGLPVVNSSTSLRAREHEHLRNLHMLGPARDPNDLLGNILARQRREALVLVRRALLVAAVAHDAELGLDHARLDLGDADVGVDELAHERAGEGVERVLGRAVDRAAGVGLDAGDGAEVDDELGLALRGEGREGCNVAQERKRLPLTRTPVLRCLKSRTRICVRWIRPRTLVWNMTSMSSGEMSGVSRLSLSIEAPQEILTHHRRARGRGPCRHC